MLNSDWAMIKRQLRCDENEKARAVQRGLFSA
jgi:hypothetical protein